MLPENSPDEELALAMQRGSDSALELLIARHYALLCGYLRRLCGGDLALAEDIVQEVFMQIVRVIHQYQYPRPFKAWLYAIATNKARNHYRHDQTLPPVEPDPDALERVTAPSQMDQADDAAALTTLLQALPPHQREVVILRYYEDMALNEIAEVLHIPLGTVKSRLSLGLAQLRELAQKELV